MVVVDGLMKVIPRKVPSREALQRCRLISHRGEHSGPDVRENTVAAFRCARDAGVWGIECDIRFTRDLVPVICHDSTPERVFGVDRPVAQFTFDELRTAVPGIPSLQEVLDEFGGNTHLMLEIKAEKWPEAIEQARTLQTLLAPFRPCEDFHILALDPDLFQRVDFLPSRTFLPVAELNVSALSRYALDNHCAGLGGHFLLLNNTLKREHDAQGQRLGTGFPTSRNCLFRELHRGIEWVFSNDAVKLQRVLDECLAGR